MSEVYLYGQEKEIQKIIDYIKQNNLIGKEKISLIDTYPDLTETYVEENKLIR